MHSATVELVVVALDTQPVTAEALSVAERARAVRLRDPFERRRYLAAHRALRELLAVRCGVPAASLRLHCDAHGKPFLADGEFQFNLSRSAGLAAYAFARAGAVGIDIEAIRPLGDADAVAGRAFSATERRAYANLSASEKLPGFFRGWTRTEALAKALGGGLTLAPAALDAALEDGWVVQSFLPAAAFAGAVAYKPGRRG